MGCNYYLHKNVCPHCNRSDKEIHIGKSSAGWTFSFRGHRNYYEEPYDIKSYKDWADYLGKTLAAGDSLIKDEEGAITTFDELIKLIEDKRYEKLNHTTYCQKEHPEHAAMNCWLDEDGNSFTGCEFS